MPSQMLRLYIDILLLWKDCREHMMEKEIFFYNSLKIILLYIKKI